MKINSTQAGYWGGVSPHGEIAKNYKTVELQKETSLIPGDTITMVDADDIDRMYNDFYKSVLLTNQINIQITRVPGSSLNPVSIL